MKVRSVALTSILGVSSLFGLALGACSSAADDVVAGKDASIDQATQQAQIDDANEIPCAPRLVLQTVCQQCHTRPMKSSAPFPLQRLSDVQALYDGQIIRDDMIADLEAGRMPLPPVTITASDKATLLGWLKDGTPSVAATSCSDSDAGDAGDAGAAPDDGGSDAGDAGDASDGMSVVRPFANTLLK